MIEPKTLDAIHFKLARYITAIHAEPDLVTTTKQLKSIIDKERQLRKALQKAEDALANKRFKEARRQIDAIDLDFGTTREAVRLEAKIDTLEHLTSTK